MKELRRLINEGTVLAAAMLIMLAAVGAQVKPPADEAKAPALTEVQKLQIQNLVQKMQLAQTQMQLVQVQFDSAQGDLTRLLTTLQVEGYDLDLQKLEYVKRAAKKDDPKR